MGMFSVPRLIAAVLLGVVAMPACHSHVKLSAPPRTAPLAERSAAYKALRPVGTWQMEYRGKFEEQMELGDGTDVFFPEDILPVIPDESASARYVRSSLDKRETVSMLSIGGAFALAAAVGALLYGASQDSGEHQGLYRAGLVGSGVSFLGLSIGGYLVGKSASGDAIEAYRNYDEALQDRLGICVGARCGRSVIRDMKRNP